MRVVRTPAVFDVFAEMFANCPSAVEEVRRRLGDTGELVDFWFDFVFGGKHAVFFKYRADGQTKTAFALLER